MADLAAASTELLQELLRFDTVNPPGDERAAQEHLAAKLRAAGLEVQLLGRTGERPNLVARLRGAADGPTLALLSHVDIVKVEVLGRPLPQPGALDLGQVPHEAEQAEHGDADEETVGRGTGAEPEGHTQRLALRGREPLAQVEHRSAQLVQTGERQLHLRLDARGVRHPASGRASADIVQQSRFSDPRLAVHQHSPPATGTHVGDQTVQDRTLSTPTPKLLLGARSHASNPQVRGYRGARDRDRAAHLSAAASKADPAPAFFSAPHARHACRIGGGSRSVGV